MDTSAKAQPHHDVIAICSGNTSLHPNSIFVIRAANRTVTLTRVSYFAISCFTPSFVPPVDGVSKLNGSWTIDDIDHDQSAKRATDIIEPSELNHPFIAIALVY